MWDCYRRHSVMPISCKISLTFQPYNSYTTRGQKVRKENYLLFLIGIYKRSRLRWWLKSRVDNVREKERERERPRVYMYVFFKGVCSGEQHPSIPLLCPLRWITLFYSITLPPRVNKTLLFMALPGAWYESPRGDGTYESIRIWQ